jgi:type 1 glutamine amidotransferase
MKRILTLVAVACLLPAALHAATKPLRVLLITGGCCHDYKNQKDILKKGLEARANMEVTQIHSDDKSTKARFDIYEKADWAAGYDVVIHDECSADVKDMPYVQNILGAHRSGVGAINLHCAMHCYRTGTDDWFQFIGIQSSGHGPQEPIALTYTEESHPTTKGFTNWTTIKEELYNNIKVFPGTTALTRGKQIVKKKDGTESAVETIVTWVHQYEKSRVFSTTIGHNNATVEDPRYLDLITRGVLWSAGKIDENGKPMKGYEPQAQAAK